MTCFSASNLKRFFDSIPARYSFNFRPLTPKRLRNIWISGLVDSPKPTTLIEEESSTFDSRQIENLRATDKSRENGLTEEEENCLYLKSFVKLTVQCIEERRAFINSIRWNDCQVNTMHSPDFTVELETSLRAFDGAILALSSVGGVQNQSITVDKQMIRYKLPKLVFITNLDHKGANPWQQVLNQARSKLQHHSAAIQIPIGLEDNDFKGLVDLVHLKAYYFHDSNGNPVPLENVPEEPPADMETLVSEKRRELIETVAEVDDKLAEAFRDDKPVPASDLQEAVRRATIAQKFIPVFMGDAFKYNKGLHQLLDGVINFMPYPIEASNYALDQSKNGEKHTLVALAFTMEENWKHARITYLRIFEGVIRKGDLIRNVNTGKTFEVPHLFRMDEMWFRVREKAHVGEIVVVFDFNYAPGDTFTDGLVKYTKLDSGLQYTMKGFQTYGSSEEEFGKGLPLSRKYVDGKLKCIELL